jgi:hypothetical protein
MIKKGIDLRLEMQVESIRETGNGLELSLQGGEALEVDHFPKQR